MDIYVVDTSAFLRDFALLDKVQGAEIIIHTTVLEELDDNCEKKRNSAQGQLARKALDRLYELRNRGNFSKGIKHNHNLIRFDDRTPNMSYLRFGFNPKKNDNLLLCVAKELQEQTGRRVVFLVGDKPLALKANFDSVEVRTVGVPNPQRKNPNKGYKNRGSQFARS